jgi:hypothetical protein
MRWNWASVTAACLAGLGLVLMATGEYQASTCVSAAFLGCAFAGLGSFMVGLCSLGGALVFALLGLWVSHRRKSVETALSRVERSRELAEIDAELARVDAELAALERRAG